MTLDPRTPVLVGVGQMEQRVDDPLEGAEPLEMMVTAAELAADDAGNRDLLRSTDSVRVIRGIWGYENPAAVVAERIGAPGAQTVITRWPPAGNIPQAVLSHSALAIQAGELDVVLIVGAENGHSVAGARRRGVKRQNSKTPGEPDLLLGKEMEMVHPAEVARDIVRPIQFYPIFENAIRNARQESIEDHLVRISELWSRFNDVAVANPHAWIRKPVTPEEIRTPSRSNRMVSFPYPKLMNSNSNVDQGAALIVCSVEAARRAGIPEDRFVFPHVGTDAYDTPAVSNRADLHSSPGIRLAGRRALELAEVSANEISHLDVYSCFPCAVQIAMTEIGIPEDRQATVTGGLTFGGGPMGDYVLHAIATMAEVLRADPGSKGMITANGGFLTKHSFGVYSTEPPPRPFRYEDLQEQVDQVPGREVVVDHDGPATIESYTVMYGAEGAEVGHAACLLEDGRRTWANTRDPDITEAMTREEFCGRTARIDGEGNLSLR